MRSVGHQIHNSHAGTMAADAQEYSATITDSQITQNTAGNTGGGIYNDDSTTLSKSSVYNNQPNNCFRSAA